MDGINGVITVLGSYISVDILSLRVEIVLWFQPLGPEPYLLQFSKVLLCQHVREFKHWKLNPRIFQSSKMLNLDAPVAFVIHCGFAIFLGLPMLTCIRIARRESLAMMRQDLGNSWIIII